MSENCCTFALDFPRYDINILNGVPENFIFLGRSENMAKIHMSDVVANRIEP